MGSTPQPQVATFRMSAPARTHNSIRMLRQPREAPRRLLFLPLLVITVVPVVQRLTYFRRMMSSWQTRTATLLAAVPFFAARKVAARRPFLLAASWGRRTPRQLRRWKGWNQKQTDKAQRGILLSMAEGHRPLQRGAVWRPRGHCTSASSILSRIIHRCLPLPPPRRSSWTLMDTRMGKRAWRYLLPARSTCGARLSSFRGPLAEVPPPLLSYQQRAVALAASQMLFALRVMTTAAALRAHLLFRKQQSAHMPVFTKQ